MLPKSEIDAFIAHPGSVEIFKSAWSDWRLSRVTLNFLAGGIDAATERYASHRSPPLVAVEVDKSAEEIDAAIELLAQRCAPETRAIVMGNVNDVTLYRRLIGMGVSDYLVRPFGPGDLFDSVARALGGEADAKTGRIVAVIGAKGGVGTTTMAQALSLVITETLDEHVLLLDLCGACGTMGIALGAEAKQGLEDILSQSARFDADALRRAAVSVGDRLLTIPGGRPTPSLDREDATKLEALLQAAASVAPVVVVDLPSGWGPLAKDVTARADHVIVVSTPMLGSLRNAHAMVTDLKERRGADAPLDLVMNFSGAFEKAAVAVSDAQKTLGLDAAAVVPFAPAVFAAAETAGQPFKQDRAGRRAVEPLVPLARRAAGIDGGKMKPARRRAILGLF